MKRKNLTQAYSIIQNCVEKGIAHVVTNNDGFYPNNLYVNGKVLTNFALLDYLGLATDERVKKGAIDAINKYGVTSPSSKTYIGLDIHDEAENLLSKIFGNPVVLFSRSTLAHIGVLPAITNSDEAIIIDHQAHTSMQITTDMLRTYGNYVEIIRHNRIDLLEERIKVLKDKYSKVWYLTDSVFSMYGDVLDCIGINRLLNEYEQFHLYVDDAHGMSWEGENGKGFLLNRLPSHPRMVLITSLGKGFGSGGGAVICNNLEMKKWITTCASPLIFSLPVYPATLGAIVESAKIHLSTEIYLRQKKLSEIVSFAEELAKKMEIPVISHSGTPLLFIAAGKIDFANELCVEMLNEGYFISVSHYPAVPINNSGLRIAFTTYNSREDIIGLLNTLKEKYQIALDKRGITVNDILKHYKLEKTEKVIVA